MRDAAEIHRGLEHLARFYDEARRKVKEVEATGQSVKPEGSHLIEYAGLMAGFGPGTEQCFDPATKDVVAVFGIGDSRIAIRLRGQIDERPAAATDFTVSAFATPAPSIELLASWLITRIGGDEAALKTREGRLTVVGDALRAGKVSARRAARTAGMTIDDLAQAFRDQGLQPPFDL